MIDRDTAPLYSSMESPAAKVARLSHVCDDAAVEPRALGGSRGCWPDPRKKTSGKVFAVWLAVASAVAVEPAGLSAAEKARDFFGEGVKAAQGGRFDEAATLFAQMPADDPQHARKLALIGCQLYAERLGRPQEGLAYAQKAYDEAPSDKDVVYAFLRTHVLAGDIFDPGDLARERGKGIDQEHEFLVTRLKWEDPSPRLPRAALEADLDLLEHYLVRCFAYLELRPVNYRGALDAIRASLDDETTVNAFTLRIAKLISLFCDGHARVVASEAGYLPRGYAPFAAGSYQGRTFLYEGDAFLDAEHPYVVAMDGKDITEWLRVAGFTVVRESPQWHLRGALDHLKFITWCRAELGLPNEPEITLKLESSDGQRTKELRVPLAQRPGKSAEFPRGESRRIGDIGYLRLSEMTSNSRVLDGLDEWMDKFRDTHGLILDVRGNSGGTKDILHTLFPYFMKPGAPMRIVEMSVYRLPMPLPKPNIEGFGMSPTSGQSATSSAWKTDDERRQVVDFIARYRTEWKLPEGKFSEWHAMGLDSKANPKAYYYDKPLVVLQDAGTFSAGDILVGAFEEHPNTTQIGVATGGGNGKMEIYTLPNSKLRVVLCRSAKFRANGKLYDGIGIAPDVEMAATPEDILGRSDTVLDAALRRLGRN